MYIVYSIEPIVRFLIFIKTLQPNLFNIIGFFCINNMLLNIIHKYYKYTRNIYIFKKICKKSCTEVRAIIAINKCINNVRKFATIIYNKYRQNRRGYRRYKIYKVLIICILSTIRLCTIIICIYII